MPRLIDADRIVYSWVIDNDGEEHDGVTLQSIIDKMPTVDAEPVRHGHWINHYDDLFPEESTQECSVCHAEQMGTMLNDNYCPNCGARMDEVTVDKDTNVPIREERR